jgi:ElaB/YqjD/DUF883 family membrane-anchored ribosome-binding protein
MVNQQALAEHWSEVRDQIHEKWEHISADDLPRFPGNVDQLVGSIQQKTGESREMIEDFLATLTDEGSHLAADARERLREGTERLAETAQRGVEQVREGYREAQRMVRNNPGQAAAMAFGLGLVCGLGMALVLRSRPAPPSRLERGRQAGERMARQMRETLAACMPGR